MHVGMTYDLRDDYLAMGYGEEETAEFDRLSTIEGIEGALGRLGHRPERIGQGRRLVERLAAGDRWDLVFNIAEGLRGIGREAQVPAILDLYGIPYTFSDPLVLSLTLHKGLTKRILRDAGLPTSPFREVARLEDLDGWDIPYPLFAKPLAEGTGKGIDAGSVLRSEPELRQRCALLLSRFRQPVLVESFLPGREFTVGIVGTGEKAAVLGTHEVLLRANAEALVYGYANKENSEERVDYRLVSAMEPPVRRAEAAALAAWRLLGCRDAGRIDLRCDAQGEPQIIELNPLAGLHPEHSDLPMIAAAVGMSFDRLVARILESAVERSREVVSGAGGGAPQRRAAGGAA